MFSGTVLRGRTVVATVEVVSARLVDGLVDRTVDGGVVDVWAVAVGTVSSAMRSASEEPPRVSRVRPTATTASVAAAATHNGRGEGAVCSSDTGRRLFADGGRTVAAQRVAAGTRPLA